MVERDPCWIRSTRTGKRYKWTKNIWWGEPQLWAFPSRVLLGIGLVPGGDFLVAQTVKNPPAMWETWVRSLGWEDSPPGEGNGNPLHYSCLENSMDRGAWRGYSTWSSKESVTSERLSPHWWRSWKLCLWQEMPTRAMRFPSQGGSHVCPVWVSFLRYEPSLGTTENGVRKSRVHCCGTTMLLWNTASKFLWGIISLKEIITERRNSGSALLEMGAAQRLDTPPWPLTSNPTPPPLGAQVTTTTTTMPSPTIWKHRLYKPQGKHSVSWTSPWKPKM